MWSSQWQWKDFDTEADFMIGTGLIFQILHWLLERSIVLSFFMLWQDFGFHLGLSGLKIAKVQTDEAFQTLAAFAGAVAHEKG